MIYLCNSIEYLPFISEKACRKKLVFNNNDILVYEFSGTALHAPIKDRTYVARRFKDNATMPHKNKNYERYEDIFYLAGHNLNLTLEEINVYFTFM
jgi:hypothetical protein